MVQQQGVEKFGCSGSKFTNIKKKTRITILSLVLNKVLTELEKI
jgi:hypothetical protein